MMTSRAETLDDSLAGVVITVISSVLAAAFVMVALRVYARAILISKFGIDDWASVISLVGSPNSRCLSSLAYPNLGVYRDLRIRSCVE